MDKDVKLCTTHHFLQQKVHIMLEPERWQQRNGYFYVADETFSMQLWLPRDQKNLE